MKPSASVVVLVGLLAAVSSVQAAMWLTSMGTLTTSTRPAPVIFEWGENANHSRNIGSLTLSHGRTSFTGTFNGRAGAEAVTHDVLRIRNGDAAPVNVTVTGDAVTSARIAEFEWRFMKDGVETATLDHKSSAPKATLSLQAGEVQRLDLRIVVGGGSRASDGGPFSVRLSVG